MYEVVYKVEGTPHHFYTSSHFNHDEEINPKDVWWCQGYLALDDKLEQKVCYKLEVWCWKDVGIYQAGMVKWKDCCIVANIGSSGFGACPILGTKSHHISTSSAFILTIQYLTSTPTMEVQY